MYDVPMSDTNTDVLEDYERLEMRLVMKEDQMILQNKTTKKNIYDNLMAHQHILLDGYISANQRFILHS